MKSLIERVSENYDSSSELLELYRTMRSHLWDKQTCDYFKTLRDHVYEGSVFHRPYLSPATERLLRIITVYDDLDLQEHRDELFL